MGAFFLCARDAGVRSERLFARGTAALLEQGFDRPTDISTDDYHLVCFPKYQGDQVQLARGRAGDFALLTGTAIFEDVVGAAAAARFLEAFRFEAPCWSDIFGHYCAIMQRAGKLYLFVDRLGIYKVYANDSRTVFSSSFVAVCEGVDDLAIDSQGVYEYAFQGATYGGSTVMRKVQVVDGDGYFRLTERAALRRWSDAPSPRIDEASFERHVERNLHNARRVYRGIAAGFGDRVDSGLSGGYDSRLTLALLRERGITPALHVYGRKTDPDVRVGLEIAAGENLALTHVDKAGFPVASPDRFPSIVENNFRMLDGCPPDGIFDGGSDVRTRQDRCAHGELMLNGGGGEIFRNFFYLPNRRFSVRTFLWSFYSRYDPSCCTGRFSEGAYLARMGEKVLAALGAEAAKLERSEIELLYPLFRCRYWMGKNNSNNNRFGWAMTPFMDYETVCSAARVPLRYKQHGRLQAALIREVDARLAGYASVYGHDFSADPPLRTVISDQSSLLRPPILRRYTYRLRHRRPAPRRGYLTEEYVDRAIDGSFPILSRFFRVDRINDPALFGRICTLEFLFERFSPADGDRLD